MEEGNGVRLSPLRPGSVPIASQSPRKLSPRGAAQLRRATTGRPSRYEPRASILYCFRNNRVVLWLLLITMWAYAGFYFQSRWAHGDNKEDLFSGGYGGEKNLEQDKKSRRDLMANVGTPPVVKVHGSSRNMDVVPPKPKKKPPMKRTVKPGSRRRSRSKVKETTQVEEIPVEIEIPEEEIPKTNATYKFLVGPFGSVEDTILEWSPETRSGTCDRKGAFARLVWSRKIVLIFHELSMTGAPLAMMELATEFLSCGATVSVVVLNRKGGLMSELVRRKIRVISDKNNSSFRSAMKADLIIAGSAVCSSWIEQYLDRTVLGSTQIIWWIMENRREYFDRSKPLLNKVKRLVFLSESQSKQWLEWCEEEKIQLNSEPSLIPLSVNDELAFVAGIQCSLNTPSFSVEKMQEKRQALRSAVRQGMGLNDNDTLAITLSSITPGKGQFMLLESASLLADQGLEALKTNYSDSNEASLLEHDYFSRALLQDRSSPKSPSLSRKRKHSKPAPKKDSGSHNEKSKADASSTKLLPESRRHKQKNLKILIGSVGLKSNKADYVKRLLTYLSDHSNLSSSVLWTPATTRVAALYAAADVYVMNSQGVGETFGRVTIEAMAFGLPVLGTNAGGTMEIVEHNVTGLLHPVGRAGAPILAENLEYLLENPSVGEEMGRRGREKVKKMYLKKHMYQKFGEVLYKSMRIK